MIVYDLVCSMNHRFEGWFGNRDDFIAQKEQGILVCPVCGEHGVERLPSASRLNLKHQGREAASPNTTANTAPAPGDPQMTTAVEKLKSYIETHFEDVGRGFAEEAKKIHYGESELRNIRGQATADEVGALVEEGIEAVPIPPTLSDDKDKLN